ncbi:MAG: phenylalanine--tRNA ligase subunit beta [Treponema sp. GWB1_62_6]|nr:MAG: phenylalanine--tRNA ligase subunit beta [Treponema sp. GWB1_62_6]OHE68634.1 MAG: phenylalanine--tRNA ligase subunit beta [Treponema sp. GWC1_61_84]HCM26585.1 phenylalanine--tRNA ligase subunit beta [Treponema sp.]
MPKIEVNEQLFHNLVGRRWEKREEFEEALTCAKAELDEDSDKSLPAAERILKIELNDTNRPDLWSTAGCARQLRVHSGGSYPAYPFFSREGAGKQAGKEAGKEAADQGSGAFRVVVDPALKDIRPYIAAFVVTGKPIDEETLKDIIQTQEKLCWNYGRKRRSIAMGVYRTSLMKWPVHYSAADPDKTAFVPLGMDEKLSLREMLSKHPKGQEYGHIVADFKKFPYLADDAGETLSFPPVINSARIGAVEVGDGELFVEMTGTDLESLTLAASMVACDFADLGYSIKSVRVEYPYDTPFGRSVTFPYYFQKPTFCSLARVKRFLGEELSAAECVAAVQRMGCHAEAATEAEKGETAVLPGLRVYPAEYRNDFLHAADVVEDVMIGRMMKNFAPLQPRDFTIGRLTPITSFSRKAKESLIGLGYQEMIYNYLGSGKDFVEKMRGDGSRIIRIVNPMSENFEYVRDSILPCLMMSESVSGNAVYPHRIFEVGKVAYRDDTENYGVKTRQHLGFLHSSADANFNVVSSQLQAVFYYLSRDYAVKASDDARFIPGRAAAIMHKGERIGVFGELHPELLENWGVTMPCTAAEFDLDALL